MDTNWIAQSAILLGIGALAYFMKDLKKSIEKQIQQNKDDIKNVDKQNKDDIKNVDKQLSDRIDKVDEKIENFKDHVNRNFVDKESYVRNITSFDNKLDKITDLIMEMKGEQRRE